MSINLQFLTYKESVVETALGRITKNPTILVFPSEAGKLKAVRQFHKTWTFSKTLFLTMEEFTNRLFLPKEPLLKEEKRTLALYACLSETEKKFFKINNYFQFIELAQNFFSLWEEFNQECVPEKINSDYFLKNDSELLGWQQETFQHLLNLKRRYKSFLEKNNLNDKIFTHTKNNLESFYIDSFKDFIFVNQFYYTNLEKAVLHFLDQQHKNITVIYQLSPHYVDRENLNIKDFTIQKHEPLELKNLYIYECPNNFTMMNTLVGNLDKTQTDEIVDIDFFHNPYSAFLSPEKFNIRPGFKFPDTSIYQFFNTCFDLLQSIIYEPNRRKNLLPINNLIKSILCVPFFKFISNTPDGREYTQQENVLNFLYKQVESDYKYFDLEGEFLKQLAQSDEKATIESILEFCKKAGRLHRISDFIEWIDNPDYIEIEPIITEHEKKHTNIREVFYNLLSDFQSLENLNLINDWSAALNPYSPAFIYKDAVGLLKLFLEYMKSRTLKVNFDAGSGSKMNITDLFATRNLSYNNLSILNVIEGKLPYARQVPFLFTEKQRKILGLKTYDDIKLREKYYFFRLVANSEHVSLYTLKNMDKNIDSSSFVEELVQILPKERVHYNILTEENYKGFYNRFLSQDSSYNTISDTTSPSFYKIPLDKKTDFPQNDFLLTHYRYKSLKENPFIFYIKHICGLQDKLKKAENDFSNKLIGNLAHDIITRVWNNLDETCAGPLFGYDFGSIKADFISKTIFKTIQQIHYFYKLPHNHAKIYFEKILVPSLTDGIVSFFQFMNRLKPANAAMEILPEKEYAQRDEQSAKAFLKADENALVMDIKIRGRADLRINIPEKQQHYIIDYKTGGFDGDQLVFYELFYFLLTHPEKTDQVKSFFYQLFDAKETELLNTKKRNMSKQQIFDQFKADTLVTLQKLTNNGFFIPSQKSQLTEWPEITRKDLFLSLHKNNAETEA